MIFSDPACIFSNILDINFTFVFLIKSCHVSMFMMTRYKFFGGIFFYKKEFIFLNRAFFVEKLPNFTSCSK
jgi:hypothetical protein